MMVIFGTKVQLRPVGADQQVADEQRVPGKFGNNAHRQRVGRVSAAAQVLHEKVLVLGVGDKVGIERLELCRRYRLVVVPPHLVFGIGVAHDELVLGRTAGVLAGIGDECAIGCQLGFAGAKRQFVKIGSFEIVANRAQTGEAAGVDSARFVERAGFRFRHFASPVGNQVLM
jgi:hypothetical protein